jgi:phosphoribosylformylglycinamidine cyclo-ligase
VSGDRGAGGPLDYRTAGVDIAAAEDAKRRIRRLVESTFTPGVRGAFGGFGGMFRVPDGAGRGERFLVASADGVGTKIKVAIEAGRHDTIGHDLVNHCANDILVQGAEPLFFLDYVAFGVLDPAVAAAIVAGVAEGCRENACALIGGETAEMPGVYAPPDYDLAGFIVGIVDAAGVLGADRVREGDAIVGLASNGFHTNGYSLIRRILTDRLRLGVQDRYPGTDGTVADVLLRVHRSYGAALRPVLADLHGLAHITGGGMPGNVGRVLPPGLDAVIRLDSWEVPAEFQVLEAAGDIEAAEMFRAFNMGVGMIAIAAQPVVDRIILSAGAAGIAAWELGEVVRGAAHVILR